ncbi:MAG: S8 family serine peptidase [Phycisphaerales bacterium]
MSESNRGMQRVGAGFWISTIALLGTAGFAWAAGEAPASRTQIRPRFVAGEVLVQFQDARSGILTAQSGDAAVRADQANLLRLQSQYGMQSRGPVFRRVHEQLRQGRLGIASGEVAVRSRELLRVYRLKTERDVEAVCAELRADPAVRYAQPNYVYYPCSEPNDPQFPNQYAHQLIQLEDAWDISTGSKDIVVAVLDTGVDVNHPDLKDNIWVNPDEIAGNGVDDDGNGYVDDLYGWNLGYNNSDVTPEPDYLSYYDVSNHGTMVSGVIAGVGNNGVGVCGVNWQCSIMALRLGLDFTTAQVAEGLDYAAANGARIVNMSFGADMYGADGDQVVNTAIDNAYEQGVLLVASAGNEDRSRPLYPAAYPNVLAVSATNGEDMKSDYSCFGSWVDIAAPGTDIVTTDMDGQYVSTAGTSFSSPYVAAVAALLLAHRPELTSIQARAILENTTDPVYYGDMDPNLGYIGAGRVNAYSALQAADEPQPLGEIFSPRPHQAYPADGSAIELRIFAYGDTYRLDYRPYGGAEWTAITAGDAPTDANALASVSLPNPGVGTYELRVCVTRGGRTHVDTRLFTVTDAVDQAGWPMFKDATEDELYYISFLGSPICMDLNGDGRNEIVQSLVDYSISIADYFVLGGARVNLWGEDGDSLPNWPVEMEYAWPSSLAVGDIDGDGDYEVVMACEEDGEVYAYHVESGRLVDGDWPVWVGGYYGYVTSGPVLADLDGDGDSEILVALDYADTTGLSAIQGDGSYLWQRQYTSEAPMSVADVDHDGDVEILVSGYGPGMSRLYTFLLDHKGQQVARWLGGSPKGVVTADLDNDGTSEIVFCSDSAVLAVHPDGKTLWKTPVDDSLETGGGLCVGDLDNDGFREVYMTTLVQADGFVFTRVYALDHEGRLLADAGYPKTMMGYSMQCAPLIADIDGDGRKELIVAPGYEPVMAWEADGSVTPGFPMLTLVCDYKCNPALADLDSDGDLEIMAPTDDYRFHVLDLTAPYVADEVDWGMLRHDAQNSSWVLAAPQVDLTSMPTQVKAGERVQIQLTALNPADLALNWLVGPLPEGGVYDDANDTISWEAAVEQVFQSYRVQLLVTDGVHQDSRIVSVEVLSNAIYSASMSVDPNWTFDDGWSWGELHTIAGPRNYDPFTARTGRPVVGYALWGNYKSNVGKTRYATTPAIDCRGFKDIRLSFWRWLTVESPDDGACVQVSNDGATWTDLWVAGKPFVKDEAWQAVEYAVPPEIGDDQATVYFRWGFGPTDAVTNYGGWNIDDVQVAGESIR